MPEHIPDEVLRRLPQHPRWAEIRQQLSPEDKQRLITLTQSGPAVQPHLEAVPEKGFLTGFGEAAGETFRGLKALGQGLRERPWETSLSVLKGLGPTSIPQTSEEIRQAKLAAAERQGRREAGFGERLGRAAETGTEFLAPMAAGKMISAGVRGAMAGAGERALARQAALREAKGVGALVSEKVPDLSAVLTDALESTRTLEPPSSSFMAPPASLPSTASAAETRARQITQGLAEAPIPPAPPVPPPPPGRLGGRAPTLEDILIQALEETRAGQEPSVMSLPTQAEGLPAIASAEESLARQALQRGTRGTSEPVRHIPGPQRVGPTVSELRGAYGAKRTAKYMNQMPGLREDLGMPVTRGMVQDIAGGPSRQPTTATNAQLDQDFLRRIADERGSLSIADAGEILDAVRRESMLSGMAFPKSALNDVGAIASAIGEGASPFGATGILDEALRLPTNTRVFIDALKNPRAAIQGPGAVGMAGPIARTMGAADAVTQDILRRSGVPEKRILAYLLQAPEGGRWAAQLLGPENTWFRRLALPFTRTAGNFIREGTNELTHLGTHPLTRRSALTAGAMGAGAMESEEDAGPMPQILSMAALGPRGWPFALGSMGASMARGKAPEGRILSAVTPVPEMSFDPRYWAGWPPSIMRYIEGGR